MHSVFAPIVPTSTAHLTNSRGIVAAGHSITAETAVAILGDGGNAFDAVLAALFSACAAEPVLASLGGGGFLLGQRPSEEPVVYDFFAHTPSHCNSDTEKDFRDIHVDFGPCTQKFHIGMASIATPGVIRGAVRIHKELCSMPLARLIEPAVEHMRRGVSVNTTQAGIFQALHKILTDNGAVRAMFSMTPSGVREDLLETGDVHVMPDLADTLDRLACEGDRPFYEGDVAQRIVRDCVTAGGHLRRSDLMNYQVHRRKALQYRYRSSLVFTNPPPASGGLLVALGGSLLSSVDLSTYPLAGTEHLSLLARVIALTSSLVQSHFADISGTTDHRVYARLLQSPFLDRYQEVIRKHALSSGGTTHINVMDKYGNVACMTVSNGEGSGYVVPDTGIMLNNMLGEEDVNPAGTDRWLGNRRLSSMMAPTLVLHEDGATTALGSGGSNRIYSAILQVLSNMIDYGLPLDQAVKQARIHIEQGVLNIETDVPSTVVEALESRYSQVQHWPESSFYFGGVHVVRYDDARQSFMGAGDPRRGGIALRAS